MNFSYVLRLNFHEIKFAILVVVVITKMNLLNLLARRSQGMKMGVMFRSSSGFTEELSVLVTVGTTDLPIFSIKKSSSLH